MTKGKRMILEQRGRWDQTELRRELPEGIEGMQKIRDPSTA